VQEITRQRCQGSGEKGPVLGREFQAFLIGELLDPHSKRFFKVYECAVHVEERKPLHGAIL
jgi:hypothetical protein